jgi:hypothetical protein
MLCTAELPEVVAVKQFTGLYPASHSLFIPFNGCVELDRKLPEGSGELWLSLEHLLDDADFSKIEILVNSARTILGARGTFKGSLEEWKGDRGYESRKRVLYAFSGGDGPELSKKVPLAYDAGDFGSMVFTFDNVGHVSWRKPQGYVPITEEEYVKTQENHKRECDKDGCKNMTTAACIVLPSNKENEQAGSGQPAPLPESKSKGSDKIQPESEKHSR